jgi:GNAT superfamily N-acetyltransferase
MKLEDARRDDVLALMRETYGDGALSAEEFEWWFERNPVPPRLVTIARDDDGSPLGTLAMSPVRTDACLAACSVHGVTTPAARGKGVFTALERHNEAAIADAGIAWAFAFTNDRTGPLFLGPLEWEAIAPLRLWTRLRRPWRTGRGGFRVEPSCPPFEERHRAAFAAHHIVRSPEYLSWRFSGTPRGYHRVERAGGWGVVRFATWHGFSVAVVCEAVGGRLAAVVRACVAAVDSDLALALVNPGEERAYLAAGFLPTPRSIPFVAKRLREDAPPLPPGRGAWRFTLGDMDWF